MKTKVSKEKQFILVHALIKSSTGNEFYYSFKNRKFTYMVEEFYLNTEFIERIYTIFEDELTFCKQNEYDYTTKKIKFFKIKLNTGESIYLLENQFYKFENMIKADN